MMMKWTTCFRVLVLLFLTAGLVWTGAAQAEDTVNVYYGLAKKWMLPLFEEFEQATGIHVNGVHLSGPESIDRVIAEQDKPQIDVLFNSAELTSPQIRDQIFEPYRPPAYDVLDDRFKDPEGYWVGWAYFPYHFLSHQEFLTEQHLDPPTSWYDLLDPAYKGMISLSDPRTSGGALARIFSILEVFQRDEDRAFAYMKQLRAQVQAFTKSTDTSDVPLGRAGAGIRGLPAALRYQQEGYEVVISFPQEGIGMLTVAMALIQGARNPEAGRKFIDWAASPAMQNLFVKYQITLIPVHPDARIEPGLATLLEDANLFPLDSTFMAENRERIVDRWVREVLP